MIEHLPDLVKAGISSFKIEGRGKSAEYVDTVVRTYREAVDAIAEKKFTPAKIKKWMKESAKVHNRRFCDGYYLGKLLPDWSGYSRNRATEEKVYVGLVNHYFDKAKIAELNVLAKEIEVEDKILIMGPTTGVVYHTIKSMVIDEKPVSEADKEIAEELEEVKVDIKPVNLSEQAKLVLDLFNGKVIDS